MSNEVITRRYVKALLELVAQNEYTNLISQSEQILALIDKEVIINQIFTNQAISKVKKISMLKLIVTNLNINIYFANTLELLICKSRANMIYEFLTGLIQSCHLKLGNKTAELITAIPASAEQVELIKKKLAELKKYEYNINQIVNKDILGGIILRIDDLEYDFSIRSQLAVLSRKIEAALT